VTPEVLSTDKNVARLRPIAVGLHALVTTAPRSQGKYVFLEREIGRENWAAAAGHGPQGGISTRALDGGQPPPRFNSREERPGNQAVRYHPTDLRGHRAFPESDEAEWASQAPLYMKNAPSA
jgi:hypothetical protein